MVNEVTRFLSGETKTVKAGNFDALHIESNSERLGIGTMSPARTVHLSSPDATVMRIESTGSATPAIELVGSGGAGSISYNSSTGQITFGTDLESTDTQLAVDVLSVPDGGASAARISVGTDGDFLAYHTGSGMFMRCLTGDVQLRCATSSDFEVRDSSNALILQCSSAGLVTCSKGLTVNTTAGSNALTVADGTSITTLSTSATAGAAALRIDQNDTDEPFVNFDGSSAASAAANISTWTSGNSIQGFLRQAVNGTDVWIPYYDAPTS